jgi:hypothetical protein
MNAPNVIAGTLRLLASNTTPGDWDAMRGHVISTRAVDEFPDDCNGRNDVEYYGGYLVCETCERSDALFIASAKSLLPQLLDAYDALAKQVDDLQRQLRFVRMDVADLEGTLEFERSLRYVAPLRPLERAGVVLITRDNAVLVAKEASA